MSAPSVAESTYVTAEMKESLREADEKQMNEIEEYQKQYEIAVENLEIDKANELKHAIKQKKEERSQKKIDYLRNDFEKKLKEIHDSFGLNKRKIMRNFYNAELDKRIDFSRQFILLQEQHIEVLSNLETSMVDSYMQKNEKPNEEVVELFDRAKKYAKNLIFDKPSPEVEALKEKAFKLSKQPSKNKKEVLELTERAKELQSAENIDKAKKLKAKAEKLRDEKEKELQKDLKKVYKQKIFETLDKQEQEITELGNKIENYAKEIEDKKLKALAELESSTKATYMKCLKKFLATVSELKLEEKESLRITKIVTKMCNEELAANNLAEKKEAAPPKKKPTTNGKNQVKPVLKRDFIEMEFKVEFKSRASQRASSRAGSQASSIKGSVRGSQ